MCWDPGHEYREDKHSLKAAAANGGYTKVFVWPNTEPIIDNKAQYQYYSNENGNSGVQLLPICSITKKAKGNELAEILDLMNSGALLFSDGLRFRGPVKELRKAMEYTKSIDARILFAPSPFEINPDGQIHESAMSISLGLPGLPAKSEVMSVQNAISIAEYAETDFILHNISSSDALRAARSKAVSAVGVSYLNLCKNVDACADFETDYKVIPPLRDEKDRMALIKAVKSGQISYIASNHFPLDNDVKDMEFGLAKFGSSGIETVFSALLADSGLGIETIIEKLTYGPAEVASIDINPIDEKSQVNMTLFDPKTPWTYNQSTKQSKSKNNPYFGKNLCGKVLGVLC